MLIHKRSFGLPPPSQSTNIVSVGLGKEPTDIEHVGLYDGISERNWEKWEDDAPTSREEYIPKRRTLKSLSVPLPLQVIEAMLPTRQETEVSGSQQLS